jgi:energy-coupling factor transporter ATP-binding protein EcfA2
MNNFLLSLSLKNYQRRLFKIISISLYYLIIFFSLGLFFSEQKYLNLIGFWIFTIFLLDLIIFKHLPIKNLKLQKSQNLEDYLDNQLKLAILNAVIESKNIDQLDISIVNQLLNFKEIIKIFDLLEIKPQTIKKEINNLLTNIESGKKLDLKIDEHYLIYKNLQSLFIQSYKFSVTFHFEKITPVGLLLSILEKNTPLVENLLFKLKITFLDVYSAFLLIYKNQFFNQNIFIGHEDELNQILNNENWRLILVGSVSVGKRTLIKRLIWLIDQGITPESYLNKKINFLDLEEIYNKERENFENKLISLLTEASDDDQVIVFIPDPPLFLLKNYWYIFEKFLKQTPIKLFLSLTPKKLDKIPQLKTFFKIITISNFSEKDLLTILALELNNKIIIQPKALTKIALLSKNHFNNISDARKLVTEIVNFCQKNNLKVITEEIVGDVFGKLTGFSNFIFLEKYFFDNLEEIIYQKFVNQEFAVKNVVEVLKSVKKLISFIFIGPSGVGKKRLAQILANIYFNNKIIYFDLSKIKDIQSLIGEETINNTGKLTTEIKNNPYSLILLDNFEEASKEVLEIFISILNDGYFKNAAGEIIELNYCLIIAISHLFADFINQEIEKGKTLIDIKKSIKDKLINIYGLEIVKAFSDIIVFKSLNLSEKEKILEILIQEINLDLIKKHNCQINLSSSVKNYLISYSPSYFNKIIYEKILNKINEYHNVKEIDVDYHNGEFIFNLK